MSEFDADARAYLGAERRFHDARAKADDLTRMLLLVADYKNVKLEPTSGPIQAFGNAGFTSETVRLSEWPTAEQVYQTILRYHLTLGEALALHTVARSGGRNLELMGPLEGST
jgi:hypothetical protein